MKVARQSEETTYCSPKRVTSGPECPHFFREVRGQRVSVGEPGVRGTRPRGCLKMGWGVGADEEDEVVSLRNWARQDKIIGQASVRGDWAYWLLVGTEKGEIPTWD